MSFKSHLKSSVLISWAIYDEEFVQKPAGAKQLQYFKTTEFIVMLHSLRTNPEGIYHNYIVEKFVSS